ncbi:MAG: tRNA glutamyl-Q(34) synthetase GluQRS [Mariprofundaceae bacterium]
MSVLKTRFAPSPTGLLHVGNAYAALQCQLWAHKHQAELLLRIEDIDFTRCKAQFTQQIFKDLHWLGIRWDHQPRLQSQHLNNYQAALQQLRQQELIYPCFCTRHEIQAEIQRLGSAPHQNEWSPAYPGTCRNLTPSQQQQSKHQQDFAWRINMKKVEALLVKPIYWVDSDLQQHSIQLQDMDDIVIARKDIGISYHLAVVVDDALQDITHIIRGEDLQSSTPIHSVLQALLKLPRPTYHHHRLIKDKYGKRLAKRDQSTTLQSLRAHGIPANKLRQYLLNNTNQWPFESQDFSLIDKQLGSLDKAPHDSPA